MAFSIGQRNYLLFMLLSIRFPELVVWRGNGLRWLRDYFFEGEGFVLSKLLTELY